jgi:hypothetical protein
LSTSMTKAPPTRPCTRSTARWHASCTVSALGAEVGPV